MPDKTDLHEWQYPVRGDGNYESILTALFQAIDRDTILVDTDGNRSDYTPKNNALYLTSDTDELYRGDGSSWNLIGTVGGGGDSGSDGSYTDSDAIQAINSDADHGSTAPHDYTTSASGLSDVSPDSDASAHHEAFTTTDHDGRDHESALSSTFGNASAGEHIVKTLSGWSTEAPPSGSGDSIFSDTASDNPSGGNIYESENPGIDEIRFGVANTGLFTDVGVNAGTPPFDYGGGSFAFNSNTNRFIGHNGTEFKDIAFLSDTGGGSNILAGTADVVWDNYISSLGGTKTFASDWSPPKTIYVDSTNGDDSNGGTSSSDAFKTLQRAFEEVPFFTVQGIDIVIVGNYTYQGNSPEIMSFVFGGNDARIKIRPSGSSSTINLDRGNGSSASLSAFVTGNEPKDCLQIEDITFESCRFKPRSSQAELKNCTLKPDPNSAGGTLGGYSSRVRFVNCDFQGPHSVTNPAHNKVFVKSDCTGNTDYIVGGYGGAGVDVTWENNSITLNNSGQGGYGYKPSSGSDSGTINDIRNGRYAVLQPGNVITMS